MLGLEIFVKGVRSAYKQKVLNSKGLTTRTEKMLWNKLVACENIRFSSLFGAREERLRLSDRNSILMT